MFFFCFSINLGKLIDTLLTDYDVHQLPEEDGVNVTIELHVQVQFYAACVEVICKN